MALWFYDKDRWKTINMHKKENNLTAFICGGGPSLSLVDPLVLQGKNRLIVGMNNTYPFIQPDIWVGMDIPECYDSSLFWEPFPKIMRGNYGSRIHRGYEVRNLNSMYFADVVEGKSDETFFDMTEDMKFSWKKNTLAFALQFTLWLGVKNIRLVGVDLDNSKKDYHDGTYLSDAQRASNSLLYDQLFPFLKWFNVESQKRGINVASCSHNSRINEIFPYIHYMDAIKYLEIDVPRGRLKTHVLEKDENE
jgi:hypothetical protein